MSLNKNIEYKWSIWLKQPIRRFIGDKEKVPRHTALREFIEEGIFPLIKSAGYSLTVNPAEITKKLLHILFVLWQGKELRVPELNPAENEYFEQFNYILDSKKWGNFWRLWNEIEDFEEGAYGYCLRIELHYFLWTWVDFDTSPIIQNLFDEVDDMENNGRYGRNDEYQSDLYSANVKDKHLY